MILEKGVRKKYIFWIIYTLGKSSGGKGVKDKKGKYSVKKFNATTMYGVFAGWLKRYTPVVTWNNLRISIYFRICGGDMSEVLKD